MSCALKGCDEPEYAAGFCSKHYNRLRTTGTFADGPRARGTMHDRLWSKIDKRGPDECWNWTARPGPAGYGHVGTGGRGGRMMLAHRAVWEEIHGPIPKDGSWHGRVILHTCDNRLCCNPAHLRMGTQADNVKDMDKKGRRVSTPHLGEDHGMAKLTDDQVREIRASTLSHRELGRRFGVTHTMVGYIKRRQSWRHVT